MSRSVDYVIRLSLPVESSRTYTFILCSHGLAKAILVPSGEIENAALSGFLKKSSMSINGGSAAKAEVSGKKAKINIAMNIIFM